MNVYDTKGKSIWLGESVGRGGEATVYRVRGQTGWLAKIYEPAPRPNYADKLAWMVGHPPENPTRSIAHPSLAWPFDLLYESKDKLVGYLMPHIRTAVPILEVFNPRLRLATLPRFDRRYLHRTARNLSATLGALHACGYVVGDLNESNVLVTPSALISLIDTDSFQVQVAQGKQIVYHPCPVGKLEYTPPELQNLAIGRIVRQPEHDAFALGVIIFQLLMEGSHPFRAQWLGNGEAPPIETRIAQGVFPYTASAGSLVRPPKAAPDLNQLHPALSELVLRCFTDGHNDPQQRPVPEQWERALVQAENALVQCPNHHLYSNHLPECPNCHTAATPKKAATARRTGFPRPEAAAQPGRKRPAEAPPVRQQPAYPSPRPAAAVPAFDWRAFIAAFMTMFWPQPAYPSWTPSRPTTTPPPPPPRPQPISRPQPWPAYHQLNLWAWAKPRLTKSLLIGGGLGALVGALTGSLGGMAGASLGEMAALTTLWALGGASAGVLRGWKPGYQMSVWVNRRIGWQRLLPAAGLLAGAVGGMLIGTVVGCWLVLPVLIGLISGAHLGKQAGRKVVKLGASLGWERIWAGLGAGSAALFGWWLAAWLGDGTPGSLAAQAAASLAGWLFGSTPGHLVSAAVSGALCGALGGSVAGSLTDLVARFTGLVD
jgi:serine/threonine protein kinase